MSLLFTLRDRDVMVDPCYAATTWLVWFSVTFGLACVAGVRRGRKEERRAREAPATQGYLWPAIIFVLCFVYFDHNGGSASSASDKKPPSIRLVLFLWTCIRLHRGEHKFAPVERVEQPEVSKEEKVRLHRGTQGAQETISSSNTMTTSTTTLMVL